MSFRVSAEGPVAGVSTKYLEEPIYAKRMGSQGEINAKRQTVISRRNQVAKRQYIALPPKQFSFRTDVPREGRCSISRLLSTKSDIRLTRVGYPTRRSWLPDSAEWAIRLWADG